MPRPKGVPNRNKRRLLHLLKEAYGDDCHPILKMADIATDDKNDVRLRFDAWKEIAKYTEPQLKAIEQSGSLTIGEMSEEELDAAIKQLIDS